MISVGDAINEPRYPSLKAIMGAKKKPLDRLSVADAGLDPARVGEAGSLTTVLRVAGHHARPAGRIIEDEMTDQP